MATPREELERLRALSKQRKEQQMPAAPAEATAPAAEIAPPLTPRQELEQLRQRQVQAAPVQAVAAAGQQPAAPEVATTQAAEPTFTEKLRAGLAQAKGIEKLPPDEREAAIRAMREETRDDSALRSVLSSIIAEPVAGLAGAVTAPFVGVEGAAKVIEDTRRALTVEPKTERAKAGVQRLGDLIKQGIDIANIPISGLAAIGELVTGQGVDQATETIKSIQKEGVSKTLGERAFEETGSPLVASIAEAAPEGVLAALGVKKTPGGVPDITPQRAKEIDDVLKASEKAGVDVMTSDVFQPKSILSRMSQQFSERIPMFGVGGKRGAQQAQRVEALEALDKSTPRVEAGDIFSSLEGSANKVRKAAGKRLDNVVSTMTPLGAVPVANVVKKIDFAIDKLSRPGKLGSPDLVKELDNLKQTATDAGSSFESLREFRTDARAIADKVDATGRSQLRSTDKALMDDVISGITQDLDNFVLTNSGESGLAKYKAADRVYAQEARKLTKSRLKTVLDKGDVKPELVNNLLYSSSPSEVKLLFKNLDTRGRQNARMSLYRRAIDNATRKGEISPQRFVSELDKLKGSFDTFFRGEAKAELQGLKKLMEATKRADVAGVVTPTGQALQMPATAAVAAAAAVGDARAISALLGASTIGLAARAYESVGVRNMLIRLGKAPKRSTLETDLKRAIPLLLAEASRGIEQEAQAEESP